MLMLLAPAAVALLEVAARSAKQWRASKEVANNTSEQLTVVGLLPLDNELHAISTSNDANEVRANLQRGIDRFALSQQVLQQEGAWK